MIKLDQALRAWGTPEFEAVLKQEIVLHADQLPLHQGLSTGNYVAAEPVSVAIISVVDLGNEIRVKAGIFYKSVLGGCSCTDDPTPASEFDEYCMVQMNIDKTTAATAVSLLPE